MPVTLWAVAVGPTLCMGGWLGHPCARDSHETHACEKSEEASLPPDEDHRHDCQHENNCSADPCSELVRFDEDWSQDGVADLCPITLAILDDAIQSALCPLDMERVRPPPNSHHVKGRPFPDRDIPLLI